jgi:hypothetical protein
MAMEFLSSAGNQQETGPEEAKEETKKSTFLTQQRGEKK